jgi:hypothetical protein
VKDDTASAVAFLRANGFRKGASCLKLAEDGRYWANHWHEEAERYSLQYCEEVGRNTRAREALAKVGKLYRSVLLEVRQRRLADLLCPLCGEGIEWDTAAQCRVCPFCTWREK